MRKAATTQATIKRAALSLMALGCRSTRMMVMNIRWGSRTTSLSYMGGDEARSVGDYRNLARNLPPDGMLHRCAKNDRVRV